MTWSLRAAISTEDLVVMRYKMSSCISSAWGFFAPHAHPLSFIYPSIIQATLSSPFQPVVSLSHSSHPNTFLSFILFPSASYSSYPPSLSALSHSLSPRLWDISLSPLCLPALCLAPSSFPCDEWVCLLGAVHIYWAGEGTLSVSGARHISIPPLKRQREQEVTARWEEEGGHGQKIHSSSHHNTKWLAGEHTDQQSYSF